MKRLLLLVILVGLIAGAMWLGNTFPAANSTAVDLDLLWVRIPNIQVWLLTLLSIGLGLFLGGFVMGWVWLRGWVVNRRYRKAIKGLESELHQLRSLPLSKEESGGFLAKKKKAAPADISSPATPVAAAAEGKA